MNTPTYIITGPERLGHHPSAGLLARVLGCTGLVPEWDGLAPLAEGCMAYITGHHTPPVGSFWCHLPSAGDMQHMAEMISDLELDPPHVVTTLGRISLGLGSTRDAQLLEEYITAVRERASRAERRLHDLTEYYEEQRQQLTGVDGDQHVA